MGIRVTGDDFRGLGSEALFEYRPGCVASVRAGQEAMLEKLRDLLSRRGTGRLYRSRRVRGLRRGRFGYRGGSGRFVAGMHQASAPGQPPAMDLGEYRDSFEATPIQVNGDSVEGDVVTEDERARTLEYGGWTGRSHATRILPRPHVRPALDEAEKAVDARLSRL